MKLLDRVVVCHPDSEYFGRYGTFTRLTVEGLMVVQLEGETGPLWEWPFHPQELELALRISWELTNSTYLTNLTYQMRARED